VFAESSPHIFLQGEKMTKKDKPSKIQLRIEEQEGILSRRKYSVDPAAVLIDGILLSEYIEAYQRAQRRTGVIA
jgi:hypothetical protein